MKKFSFLLFVMFFSVLPITCEQVKNIDIQQERTVDPPPSQEEEEEPDPNS